VGACLCCAGCGDSFGDGNDAVMQAFDATSLFSVGSKRAKDKAAAPGTYDALQPWFGKPFPSSLFLSVLFWIHLALWGEWQLGTRGSRESEVIQWNILVERFEDGP
jgi:hypothetical protein